MRKHEEKKHWIFNLFNKKKVEIKELKKFGLRKLFFNHSIFSLVYYLRSWSEDFRAIGGDHVIPQFPFKELQKDWKIVFSLESSMLFKYP